MTDYRGAAYSLARAVIVGAVAASAWFALENLFQKQPFPLPAYAVPIMGGAGGFIWHLLGRVPLRGKIGYYCRWILVSSVAYVWIFFDGEPVGLVGTLGILGLVIASGIGLGFYAQSFLKKDGDSARRS